MPGNGTAERVLGVGVDVHLYDAVLQCFFDLALRRARSAVEDEIERLGTRRQAELLRRDLLAVGEHRGLELDVARLVHAVHVAECRRQQVPRARVACTECLDGLEEVLVGGVELVVDLGLDAVFLAADDTDLHLENDVRSRSAGEQILGDLEILVDRNGRAVPHVRLEQRVLACVDAFLRDRDQRTHVRVQLVLGAVVGVQSDGDVVLGGNHMSELCERHCADDHVLDTEAGAELGTAGRELDDAVAARVGETLDGGVDGLGTHTVDCGKSELVFLRPAQHLGVDLGSCDRHGVIPPLKVRLCPVQYGNCRARCRAYPVREASSGSWSRVTNCSGVTSFGR